MINILAAAAMAMVMETGMCSDLVNSRAKPPAKPGRIEKAML